MRNKQGNTPKEQEALDRWDQWIKQNPDGKKSHFVREEHVTPSIFNAALKRRGDNPPNRFAAAALAMHAKRRAKKLTEMQTIVIPQTTKCFIVVTDTKSVRTVINDLMEG